MIECDECYETFPSRNKLFAHIRMKHHENGPSSSSEVVEQRFLTIRPGFEDENVYVIIKPQGMATMGTKGEISLQNSDDLLLEKPASNYKKAVPCHRLDRGTGGLVVCSKSFPTEVHVRQSFQLKLVRKRYRSIAIGRIDSEYGLIDVKVEGKKSTTLFHVVENTPSVTYGSLTTLDLWPITGRKHQLRRHLQAIGHPILGDHQYLYSTDWPQTEGMKMFLWALEIVFPDPAFPHISPSISPVEDVSEGEDVGRHRAGKCSYRPLSEEEFVGIQCELDKVREGYEHFIHVKINEPLEYEEMRKSQVKIISAQTAR